MPDTFHERLMEAKERKYRLEKTVRRQAELRSRLNEQERLILQLELQVEAEQADVDALTRMSLTNLFHTILRSKEEQLEMERQQALAAVMKLQEAQQTREELKAEIGRLGEEWSSLHNAEQEYTRLMAEREAALRSSSAGAAELAEMEERISDQAQVLREIGEAWTAGKRVLASLEAASASLEKAEGWGKWDMWGGGGMVSTHMKHNHIDDAKASIQSANYLMQQFRSELADLQRSIDIQVDISGMLKMADYWFDGFITDWVVQGRIENAQEQTLQALRQVREAVRQLEGERTAAESALTGLNAKRTAWIEQSKA